MKIDEHLAGFSALVEYLEGMVVFGSDRRTEEVEAQEA